MYEIGLELYHALKSGDREKISETRKELLIILEATIHGPFLRDVMRPEDEEIYFMIKHLPEMVDRFLDRSMPKPRQKLIRREIAKLSESKEG